MQPVLKTFEQEAWNPQMSVEIHTDGVVTLDGTELSPREQALANIILRLNAGMNWWKKDLENEREKACKAAEQKA